ncbi:MAG: hypothetical protein WCA81_15205 [Rhizomicrobium sp.]
MNIFPFDVQPRGKNLMAEITHSKQRLHAVAPGLVGAILMSVALMAPVSAFAGPIQTLNMHMHSPAPKALSPSQKAGLVAAALKRDQAKPVPAGTVLSAAQPSTSDGHTLAVVKPLVVSGDPNDSFIMLSGTFTAAVVNLKTSPGDTYVLDVAMSRPGNLIYSCGTVNGSAAEHNGHAIIVVPSSKTGGITSVSISPAAGVTMIEIATIEISKLK